ncbi:sulfotransferase family protein [Luteimonas mephitis]|uniref:sulfotransferase family protein n=1 Tax=Luteimonas mephitis TaxID=83615 RepID=UPI000410F4BE|nr:sulfotransferase family protein [Luteimonas mephitis]
MQLIVLGMHRSGTSVLARLLNLMGVYFGAEGIGTGANSENPKGFWERRDVRALNDFVLHSAGCDWNRISGFEISELPGDVVEEFLLRAGNIVLEMDAHRPWFIKEPRLCLLLPLWRRVLETPVCIHIHRSPVEVAASLQTRNQIPIEVGLALWQRYVMSAHLASEGLAGITVAHRDLMTRPGDVVSRLGRELEDLGVAGLRQPLENEISKFVDERLYREREMREDLREFSTAPQNALYQAVSNGKASPARFASMNKQLHEVLAGYESTLPSVVTPQERRCADAERKQKELERNRAVAAMLPAVDRMQKGLGQQRVALAAISDGVQKGINEIGALAKGSAHFALALEEMAARLSEYAAVNEEQRKQVASLGEQNAKMQDVIATQAKDSETLRSALAARERDLAASREQLRVAAEKKAMADKSAGRMISETVLLTRLLAEAEAALAASQASGRELDAKLAEAARLEGKRRTEVAGMHAELADRREASELVRRRLADQNRANAMLKARVRAARRLHDAVWREVEGMKASRSWRATMPVRWLAGRFRRDDARAQDPAVRRDAELIRASGLFDDAWYLVMNPDVLASGADPIEHYLLHGAIEGRDPSEEFKTVAYRDSCPGMAASGCNPLVHYIRQRLDNEREAKPAEHP